MTHVVHGHGRSGRIYIFRLYGVGDDLPAIAGVYVFTRLSSSGRQWNIIDLGQSRDMRERFCNRHAISRIRASGATHIGLCTDGLVDESSRRVVEHDLLSMYGPLLLGSIEWAEELTPSASVER